MRWLPGLLLLTGCIEGDDLELGAALQGVYLGTDTDIGMLLPLRAGGMVGAFAEVRTGLIPGDLPLVGGTGEASTSRVSVPLVDRGKGLYSTEADTAFSLAAPSGDTVRLSILHEGEEHVVEAPIAPVLKLQLSFETHPAGKTLRVPLPDGYDADYTHVVSSVLSLEGEELWTDKPPTARGWFRFVADGYTPKRIEVPGRVFREEGVVALAVTFLVDNEATTEGPLNTGLSGFLAGTAWLIPVTVAP